VSSLAVDAVTASREAAIDELARTMLEREFGDVVIGEDDRPVGIVTDRDVALAVARFDDLTELVAEDVVTVDPVTIHEVATAVDIPATMAEGDVRRIPVADLFGGAPGFSEQGSPLRAWPNASPVRSRRARAAWEMSRTPTGTRSRRSPPSRDLRRAAGG
jgi:CBS domain-containing protein